MKRLGIIYIILITSVLQTLAQVQVQSSIDSIQIWIGEQAHLTLDVSLKRGQHLVMPSFKPLEHITAGVEVLEATNADTTELDGGMVKVSKTYTLTSFDEKLYYLPPMKVKVDGKEYASKSLALKVMTMPADTLHPENFFPPKDVQDNPFSWSEWREVCLFVLLALLLGCGAAYLYNRLRKGKPVIKLPSRIIKKMLPHQKAMKAIEILKEEHLSSSENQKEYYTRLTDTLRVYLNERFGINAMEMTSEEIISRLQETGDKTMIDELRTLFTTADLVKFAKYSTLINENDANLVNAIAYINNTKEENQPQTVRVEPTISEEEKRTLRSRNILQISISLLVPFAVVALIYAVWQAWLLMM